MFFRHFTKLYLFFQGTEMRKSSIRPYRLSRNGCPQVNGYLRMKDRQKGSNGQRIAQLSAPSRHPSPIQPVSLHCHTERAKKLPKHPVFTSLVRSQASSMQVPPQCTVFNLTPFQTKFQDGRHNLYTSFIIKLFTLCNIY